jgi:protein SCO1
MITIIPGLRETFRDDGYLATMRRLALAATLICAVTACSSPAFNGVVLEPAEAAPAIQLSDSTGAPFELSKQRGKVVLVFFGYTHCPDVCPTTLVDWRHVADSLGARAADVRFVFVSVDAERDTPALAQRYAARFSPTFVGLTGNRAQIDALKSTWKIAAFRDGNPSDTTSTYTVSHPSQVFVIDGSGKLRLMQRPGLTTSQVASDIRALL